MKGSPHPNPLPRLAWERGISWLERLASVELTLVCIVLAMILVIAGTLAQVHMGTFDVQKLYFNGWWVYTDLGDWRVPVFPGGLTVGLLWMVNLVASFITRFRWSKKDIGIYLTHMGIILLLAGQFFTQLFARESQMPIPVGQSTNYSESYRNTELVLIKTSDPDFDEVTSIPEKIFLREGEIHPPRLPFYLAIHRAFKNAQLTMAHAGDPTLATQGIGMRIAVRELPRSSSDEEPNNVTALVEVRDGRKSLGTWLVSLGLGAPQSFLAGSDEYRLAIRPQRFYYPFTLTLKEFHHDIYPGTDIPRNFSSVVNLTNPEKKEARETLIYMNHPLRYDGKTFYQASFGEGDKVSILQVVENPVFVTPYVSCLMVILGLLTQFLSHLFAFTRKRK